MLLSSIDIPGEVHGDGRFVIPARDFVPAYLKTYEEGRLKDKVDEAVEALRVCTLCPRNCRVNRLENRFAVCKTGRYARVSSFFHHFGEEDVLRGWNGSGTIFFAWCNLRCVFCCLPDTRVFTDLGPRRIEDIFAVGDHTVALNGGQVRFVEGLRVYTRRGILTRVTKAFCHPHKGEVITVKPYGLPALTLTPDHKVFAALKPGGEIQQVHASSLTQTHYLVVPKPQPANRFPVLETRSILQPFVGTFRRSVHRRVSVAALREAVAITAPRRLTSRDIAAKFGYHPAYLRRLLPRLRRGELVDSEHMIRNDLVEERGRVRFKTEKGPGIPSRVPLDRELAALLGYFCAEGHVTTPRDRPNSHRLILSFGHHETDLAAHVQALIRKIFGLEASLWHRRTTVTVEVGCTSLALLCKALCGSNARNKRVPPMLFNAPTESIRAFLQAHCHGDGHRNDKLTTFTTVSPDLALGIVALLLQLGLFPYYYAARMPAHTRIEGRDVRQAEALYLVRCRNDAWDGVQSARRLRYTETEQAFWVPIREISRSQYEGPVYNIEVADQDHSYVACGVAVGNCQNFETSQIGEGEDVGPRELARMMLQLQDEGCHNINFVTPEHVVPQILEGLLYAVRGGLRLPLVYNTGSYDSLHSIALMDGVVDVYMPDFKLWDRERSRRYLLAPDYPDAARQVVRAMHEQVGALKVNEDSLAVRGALVRHLVMPGMSDDTREIMRYLASLSRDTYVNIMDQYSPAWRAKSEERFQDINRRIFRRELEEAYEHAKAAGLWRFDTRWRKMPARARLWA